MNRTIANIQQQMLTGAVSENELSQATKRCDFLVLNVDKKTAYFIELKGKHITHAIEQLEQTYDLLKKYLSDYSYFFRIVASKVVHRSKTSPQYRNFAKKYDLQLDTNIEENI